MCVHLNSLEDTDNGGEVYLTLSCSTVEVNEQVSGAGREQMNELENEISSLGRRSSKIIICSTDPT